MSASQFDTMLYGYRYVQANGSVVSQRSILNFIGLSVADNPTNNSTDVTLPFSAYYNAGTTEARFDTVGAEHFRFRVLTSGYNFRVSTTSGHVFFDTLQFQVRKEDGSTVLCGTNGSNFVFFGSGSFATEDHTIFMTNVTTAPDPANSFSGGGKLFAQSGALKYLGSSGTTTTLGAAEPHCPKCGRDFVVEWQNWPRDEHLTICMPCMLSTLDSLGVDTGFAFNRSLR